MQEAGRIVRLQHHQSIFSAVWLKLQGVQVFIYWADTCCSSASIRRTDIAMLQVWAVEARQRWHEKHPKPTSQSQLSDAKMARRVLRQVCQVIMASIPLFPHWLCPWFGTSYAVGLTVAQPTPGNPSWHTTLQAPRRSSNDPCFMLARWREKAVDLSLPA